MTFWLRHHEGIQRVRRAEWRPIAGLVGAYEVSNCGQVRNAAGRLLKGTPIKGYRNVRLEGRLLPIHRLVCIAFHGDCPPGKEMVGHLNGEKEDNQADNLAWITRSENTLHSIAHGTFGGFKAGQRSAVILSGADHPNAKLTPEQVLAIRSSSLGHKPTARMYRVSDRQIRRIRKGEKWASI